MVSRSNRSVLYSIAARSPWGVSVIDRVKSNLAEPVSRSIDSSFNPDRCAGVAGVLWNTNMTWKKGLRLRLRSGCSSSTSFSKGKS